MSTEEQMQYFISRTDERLESIEKKIDSLMDFKADVGSSSRAIALVISGMMGIVSVVVSALVTAFLSTHYK